MCFSEEVSWLTLIIGTIVNISCIIYSDGIDPYDNTKNQTEVCLSKHDQIGHTHQNTMQKWHIHGTSY